MKPPPNDQKPHDRTAQESTVLPPSDQPINPSTMTPLNMFYLNRSRPVMPNSFALIVLCLALFMAAASDSVADVTFDPPAPEGCVPITITYDATGRSLDGASQVFIHIGRNGWQDVIEPDPEMTWMGGELWEYTYATPPDTYEITMGFNDGFGTWDTNDFLNWSLSFTDCGTPPPPTVTFDPAEPVGCVPVAITYDGTGRVLDGAAQVYIHIGRNGWQNVISPNPAMTSLGNNRWEYTYNMPGETTQLNMVFNDGADTWDNNSEQDWALAVTDCGFVEPGPPATIVFSTPARTMTEGFTSDLITVQLRDAPDQVTTSEGTTLVTLSSNQPGTFRNADDTENINSITIGDGESSASFRYTSTTVGTHVLTASNLSLIDTTQNLTVYPATPMAGVYNDSVGDVFTTAGGGILDITRVEVSNTATDLLFKITVAGNPIATDWGKYMIGLDTASGGDISSNGWGRPISMSSGMDHWVGTWVDGGNGGEVWTWTGTAWNRQSATYGENPDNIGVTKDTTTVYIQFGFSGLGLSLGDSFSFDVYASGGGGGDSAIDSLANPNQTISDWGQAYDSGSILVEYTLTEDSSDPWLTDSNEDGIPDGWYLQFGFDPEGPSIAEIDTDGDGFTNRQEFLLGTNPTDPNSRFRIVSFDFDGEGLPRLTWTSVGGRTYSVEYTNDLILGFTEAAVVVEDAVADGVETTRTFVDDTSTSGGPTDTGRRTYRVQLVLEEISVE